MGSFTSKQWADLIEITSKNKNDKLDKESCSTPNLHRVLPLPMDPRSPTPEISRTPIQVEKTPISEFGKFTSKTKYDFKNNLNSVEDKNKEIEAKPLNRPLQKDFQKEIKDPELELTLEEKNTGNVKEMVTIDKPDPVNDNSNKGKCDEVKEILDDTEKASEELSSNIINTASLNEKISAPEE